MAKKFQFKLDVVRDMRKRAQDEAARQVAGKVREVAAARRHEDEFSRQVRELVVAGRGDRLEKALEIATLKMQQYHGKWLHDRVREWGAARGCAEAELAMERGKLTQATAKLKAIEKLRQRRWQRHQVVVRREEQAITDEVAGRMSLSFATAPGNVSESVSA